MDIKNSLKDLNYRAVACLAAVVSGTGALTYGLYLIYPPAAFIAIGVLLIVAGVLV